MSDSSLKQETQANSVSAGTESGANPNNHNNNNNNAGPTRTENRIINDDLDDDDDGEPGSSRTPRERRKIEIKFIQDKSRRHITFSKRKRGVMKKAYELSVLTGTQVLLLVVSETGLVYTFTTPKLQPLVTRPEGKNLIQNCLNASDDPSQLDPRGPIGDSSDVPGQPQGSAAPGHGEGSSSPNQGDVLDGGHGHQQHGAPNYAHPATAAAVAVATGNHPHGSGGGNDNTGGPVGGPVGGPQGAGQSTGQVPYLNPDGSAVYHPYY